MRFISDDNKVFNTLEECKEHEENLKGESDEKREERRKETLKVLQKRQESIIDQITEWLKDYNSYLEKYRDIGHFKDGVKDKDDWFDLRDFSKFLDIVFGDYGK